MFDDSSGAWQTPVICVLAVVIFGADLCIPLGISGWVWYILPLSLSASPRVRFSPYLLAVIFSALAMIGYYFALAGPGRSHPLADRCPAVAVLWLVAVLVSQYRRTQASMHRLSCVVEQSPDAVIITDLAGHAQYANARYLMTTGCSSAEVIGRHLRALLGGTSPAGGDQIWAAMEAGRGWTGEFEGRTKDGQPWWWAVSVSKLLDSGGRHAHFSVTFKDITRRKLLEKELRKLSRAVEQSPVSIVITDLTGAIEYINPKFAELTGYTAGEVHGRNPRFLKSGEMPAAEYQRLWQTITQGQSWHGHFHNRKKNGELFWEAASISPVTTDDGKITHFIAVKEDITQHRKAEQALRESEVRYRLISENVADIICQLDPCTGAVSYVSPSVQRLLGCTPAEALTKSIAEFMTPDSQKRAVASLRARLDRFHKLPAGARSYQDEFYLRRKDDSIVAVEATSTYMRNERGKINVIAVVRDISERKQMEREVLRRIEMEQERIGRDLHDGLCQSLVGVKFRSALLARKLNEENMSWAVDAANSIEDMLSLTIVQARDLARGLNPVRLGTDGLAGALKELAAGVEATGSTRCDCQVSLTTPISNREVALHLYRIAQETVQNALKHAQARNISIVLKEHAGRLILVVEDDGVGLPEKLEDASGSGLSNLRARARMIGGTFVLQRGPQGGCVARVNLPAIVGQKP